MNKGKKKRDEALSSLGRPQLAYGAKLLHHAQQVGDTPRLGDLASLYAIYRDAPKVHYCRSEGCPCTPLGGPLALQWATTLSPRL